MKLSGYIETIGKYDHQRIIVAFSRNSFQLPALLSFI